MAAMRFDQVQRFILAKKIFGVWGTLTNRLPNNHFLISFQYFFLPNAAANVHYQPIRHNFKQWKISIPKIQEKANHFKTTLDLTATQQ